MIHDIFAVHVWWYALCAAAVLNLGIWFVSSRAFLRARGTPGHYGHRWPHVLLSAAYVLGCGFRSILPRADVQRICVYDSWLSSVFVGRSVATVAELCFAAQWALILRELSSHDNGLGRRLSYVIFPLIATAEVFSWYAVLSTSYLGNALEQSIWTTTVALIALALYPLWRSAEGPLRTFVGTSIVFAIGFVAFMCTVDVPMYVTRWLADEANHRTYLTLAEGLRDVSSRWVVTHEWSDWHEEIAWMSFYFTAAVWFSVGLTHAPRLGKTRRSSAPQRSSSLLPMSSSPAE